MPLLLRDNFQLHEKKKTEYTFLSIPLESNAGEFTYSNRTFKLFTEATIIKQ